MVLFQMGVPRWHAVCFIMSVLFGCVVLEVNFLDKIRAVVIVRTVDGRLTGLDSKDGRILWTIKEDPLISQNISGLELISDLSSYRFVPSLDGALFVVERKPIGTGRTKSQLSILPLSVDDLVSSGFHINPDEMVSGGRHHSFFGLEPLTGRVLYNCSPQGCDQTEVDTAQEAADNYFDGKRQFIIVKQLHHTFRAASVISGNERWNFSVRSDELLLYEKESDYNFVNQERRFRDTIDIALEKPDMFFRFDVQEGRILACNALNSTGEIWRVTLASPIAKAWVYSLTNGKVTRIPLFARDVTVKESIKNRLLDLLSSHNVHSSRSQKLNRPGKSTLTDVSIQNAIQVRNMRPSGNPHFGELEELVYLGIFDGQLYVQTEGKFSRHFELSDSNWLTIYNYASEIYRPAVSDQLPMLGFYWASNHLLPHLRQSQLSNVFVPSLPPPLLTDNSGSSNRHSRLPLEQKCFYRGSQPVSNDLGVDRFEDILIQLAGPVKSRELYCIPWSSLTIFLGQAVLLWGLIAIQRMGPPPLQSATHEVQNQGSAEVLSSEETTPTNSLPQISSAKVDSSTANFVSTMEREFQFKALIGSGGFGRVFEVENRLDGYRYAIKRIRLRHGYDMKGKFIREVKAMAGLDHPGIVRYYRAWIEEPPEGWQEAKDREFLKFDEAEFEDENAEEESTNSMTKSDDIGYGLSSIESMRSSYDALGDCNVVKSNLAADSLRGPQPICDIQFHRAKTSGRGHRLSSSSSTTSDVTTQSSPVAESSDDSAKAAPLLSCYLYIQMQLCSRQSLRDWLIANPRAEQRLPRATTVYPVFLQIADAVAYLHSRTYIHRDLKPSNILFDAESSSRRIKLADFGLVTTSGDQRCSGSGDGGNTETDDPIQFLSAELSDCCDGSQLNGELHTSQVGTHLYMSPEQASGGNYDEKVDIFSLGLVFLEMVVAFGTETERILTLMSASKGKLPDVLTRFQPKEAAFCLQMLHRQPSKRLSANQILSDPIFTDNLPHQAAHEFSNGRVGSPGSY